MRSQNAEMFFADKVLLVEGGEKYILEALAKHYGQKIDETLGANWLCDRNYSVIAVGGKSEFWKYYKKLHKLGIECFILADFDFFLRSFNEFLTQVGAQQSTIDEVNRVKSKLGQGNLELKKKILQGIDSFQTFLSNEGFELDERSLKIKLKENFKVKRLDQISPECQDLVKDCLTKFKKHGIFILEKELEDYYLPRSTTPLKGVSGKEEKCIKLVAHTMVSNESITDLLNCDEYLDFLKCSLLPRNVS